MKRMPVSSGFAILVGLFAVFRATVFPVALDDYSRMGMAVPSITQFAIDLAMTSLIFPFLILVLAALCVAEYRTGPRWPGWVGPTLTALTLGSGAGWMWALGLGLRLR